MAEPSGFVPVAIWELRREGHPAVRHAWVAGSEAMLRVSWDAGATWYGFRPLFAESARGMLAVKVALREELGRGEVGWNDQAAVKLLRGQAGSVTILPADGGERLDLVLDVVSVTDVSVAELAGGSTEVGVDGGNPAPLAGGGGSGSCCASCGGLIVCDCSVCIPACHASCCRPGCFCMPC